MQLAHIESGFPSTFHSLAFYNAHFHLKPKECFNFIFCSQNTAACFVEHCTDLFAQQYFE